MTNQRAQQPSSLPVSRRERGSALSRSGQKTLGFLLIQIDDTLRSLNYRIDRAVEECQPRSAGSIGGSSVQAPLKDPCHELAFEWLDSVRAEIEELVREAPS